MFKSTEGNLLFCLFVVKATAAATGHAHLHIFRADNVKPIKMVLKKYIAPVSSP